jgi:hypothetical protein
LARATKSTRLLTLTLTGLIPSAGTTVKHSRFVADAVLNSSTTVTSATAAFTSADVGSFITGAGIPALATIAKRHERDHRRDLVCGDRDRERRDHDDHHELRDL